VRDYSDPIPLERGEARAAFTQCLYEIIYDEDYGQLLGMQKTMEGVWDHEL